MLPKRADAFEDISIEEYEKQRDRLERARRLLDEQAERLMACPTAPNEPIEAQHVPHDPHRRPLSSAARRLIRAHQKVEEAAQD